MISRRIFLGAAAATTLTACVRPLTDAQVSRSKPPPPVFPPMPARYGALTNEPYPVPAVPDGVVPPHLWLQEVDNPFPDQPTGTIIVDPDAAYLHLVGVNGRAMRYGVGVGAAGFDWEGDAQMRFRRSWPRWKAPDTMIARRPEFAPYSVANGGMDPGPGNPLGARALYLFQNGEDTLYRIHGACEPEYLGEAVSSGCIRLLDQDVIDLHDRVRDGVRVVVLPSVRNGAISQLY
ncbi:MAG: L,D-transpeptidase [Gemmobacter sp.]|nr:L,D-transpeptidase [Gemmobacter sp.]